MAEKLCTLRKSGGGMSKTVLWTNSSPTSAFAGQSVALSKGISDFKYLCIEVRYSTTDAGTLRYYYDTSELPTRVYNAGVPTPSAGIWRTGIVHTRDMYYVDNTHFGFYDNKRIEGSSVTTNHNALIPTQIIGLK